MTQAKQGDTVRIHYTGTLSDGTQFDSSNGRDPLEFELGAGQVIPGLEREIVGMAVGDTKSVSIVADEAYGPHRPEGVQEIERSEIPDSIQLEVGIELQASNQEGHSMRLRVVSLSDDKVTLDGNHPLAGKDLTFDVELVEIAA